MKRGMGVRALAGLLALSATVAWSQEQAEEVGTSAAIQERAYKMQHEIGLAVGTLPIDPFSKGLFAQGSYTIHFSDVFAWQVARGAYSYTVKTSLRDQLERDFGIPFTAFEEVQFFVGTDILLKPIYGKLSVGSAWVIHAELFAILGASLFKLTNALRPGVNVGVGGRVFLSKAFSLRLDVTDNVVIPLGAGQNLSNVMTVSLALALNIGATE